MPKPHMGYIPRTLPFGWIDPASVHDHWCFMDVFKVVVLAGANCALRLNDCLGTPFACLYERVHRGSMKWRMD
ncbi:hypothetical protein GCM10011499_39420 [Pelagibacterium lentulum]|jgi:hypothetical protein|uniref:Uncharacterized protein n=1 Tax=Pelagibacterium lentulum TaxID=2029865 RepID=A0A916RSA4_9HYPH|nr:hypothetical protein GCM10011499_39420 [Pelagibacterium lentulum]